jgi:Carboxypeptidase regulatory-like domain/TonB-dependent Receptor Plug Domain
MAGVSCTGSVLKTALWRHVKSLSITLAIAGFALCSTALAQVAVSGRVVDETGAAVSGARVVLRPSADGAATETAASSDLAGNFTLRAPAAGEYDLRVEREGFYVFTSKAQQLGEAPNQLVITLNHQQEYPEKVEVKGSPPGIDPQQPADKRALTSTEIQAIPYSAPQDYRNALQLMNGVYADNAGQFHFNGAAVSQTNYTLDGFNISNPVTGQLDTRINIDTIQTVELMSGRFTADSGRGSGGVLELTTKIGDDHWRFIGTNFIPSIATNGGFHIDKFTPRLDISGPIKKKRMWINNGFDAFYNVDLVYGLPKGQNHQRGLTADDITRFRADLKPSNILTASFLWNLINNSHNGLSFINPLQTTTDSRQLTFISTVRDQQYLSGGGLLDVGFADTRGYLRSLPQGDGLFQITPYGDLGNYYVGLDRHFYRQQVTANLFLPIVHLHGSHLVKFGIDFERESFHERLMLHDYEVLNAENSVTRFVSFSGSPFEGRRNFEAAQYVQDHWTPRDNLTVEAGLRAEWNDVVRDLEWAPRLSAAWSPHSLKDTKFSAGVGVFHDAIDLDLTARRPDLTSLSTFYLPTGAVQGPAPESFQVNDRALSTPRYTIASASVERKLPFGFVGKTGYMHRQTNNGLEFSAPGTPFSPDLFSGAAFALTNGRRNRYNAVDFTVRRTFAGRYEWFLGYTRSSTRTNAALEYSLINPVYGPQGPGPFSWDAPNRVHMWGWLPLPNASLPKFLQFTTRNTTLAYLAEYRTGFPFSVVDQNGFLSGTPNSQRLPGYFNLNVHVERQFHALRYLWAWRVGVNNLTNSGNPNYVDNVLGTPAFLTYGRGQTRAFTMRLRMLGRK